MEVPGPGVDSGFGAEVAEFIQRHWSSTGRGTAARTAWFQALVARGWSVPRWPVSHGGTGWDVDALCLWERETARAEAPDMDPVGTTLVGPLLMALGSPAQQSELLPAIRDAASVWCLALVDGADVSVSRVSLRRDSLSRVSLSRGRSGAVRLDGRLEAVPGGAASDWLLCAVGDSPLCLVDLTLAGVRRRPLTTLDGAEGAATLILEHVTVAPHRQIRSAGGAAEAMRRLSAVPGAWPLRAFRHSQRLARLRRVAGELADGAATVLDDPALQRRLTALEIELLGLESLERRALEAQRRGLWSPSRAALVALRQNQLEQRLGVLARDVLGYHSLPFPDPCLIDNEGPIGHDDALAMVAQALARPGTPLDDVAGAFHNNTIARSLLGP